MFTVSLSFSLSYSLSLTYVQQPVGPAGAARTSLNIACSQHSTGARAAPPEPPRGPGCGDWRLRERGRRGANGTNEGQGEVAEVGKGCGEGRGVGALATVTNR